MSTIAVLKGPIDYTTVVECDYLQPGLVYVKVLQLQPQNESPSQGWVLIV